MKKSLLFISTLFAAGTLAASAATTLSTITFSAANSADKDDILWKVGTENGYYVAATSSNTTNIASLTWGDFTGTGTKDSTEETLTKISNQTSANGLSNSLNRGIVMPYTSKSGGTTNWSINFVLTAGTTDISISSLTIDFVLAYGGGRLDITTSTSVDISLSAGSSTASVSSKTLTGASVSTTDSTALVYPSGNSVTLTFEDPIEVTAGSTQSFTLSVSGISNCLAGFRAITVSSIPEPSLFGLFAGTLALGLAGTRRRRGNAKK